MLQRRLLLSFNIFIAFINLNSEPAFINTELDAAGSIFSINPAQYEHSYSFIDIGCANFSEVSAFNNAYTVISLRRGFLSFNILGVINYNNIRNASLGGAGVTAGGENAYINITPLLKYESYSDGVTTLKKGLFAGASVKAGSIFSGIGVAALDGNAMRTYVNAGYMLKNSFNLRLQAEMGRGMIFGSGVEWHINENMRISASVDTEQRMIFGFCCSIGSFMPHYGAMFISAAGVSNEAGVMFISADRNFELPEVKVTEVKEKNKIKMFKTEVKFPFDINRATLEEIEAIPSIGRQTALRIYLKRVYDGDYRVYESIDSIYGIGKASMEMIKKYTYIGE